MKKILLFLVGLMLFCTTIKAQWNQYLTGQESLIRDISVVNDNVVWIKDQNNVQFSITTDGGTNWITKSFPADMTNSVIGGFSAVSATTAYLVVCTGNNLGIYKTTNSGDSWVKQTSGFNSTNSYPDFVYFWNENEGVAVGDGYSNYNFEVYTTTNGGTTWNLVPAGNFPTNTIDYSYTSNTAYKIVGNAMFFTTYKGKIYKSIDKGLHWNSINTPLTNGDNMSFDFKDANNGLLYSYLTTSKSPVLYSTTNGGQNWTYISTSNIYGNIKYVPTQSVYFSTGSGLSYSADNGQTWSVHSSFQNAGLAGVGLTPSGKIFMGGWKYVYSSTNYSGINPSISQMKVTDVNKIDITFSKNVESVSSQNLANYNVSYKQKPDNLTPQTTYPIEVASLTLDNANKSLVHIVTKTNFPLDTINISVSNVKDLTGFPLINRSSSAFASYIYNSLAVTSGKLSTLLSANDLATISDIKLTGTIDARDFVTMRDRMPNLKTIDLSETSINSYTGTDGTAGTANYTYQANEIPKNAFNKTLTSGFIPLTSIKLPNTANTIGFSAFSGCGNLKSILISASITLINESAFLGIGGLINVDSANPNYSSIDGILFNKSKTKLIQCSPLVAIGNYNIPTTVTTIGTAAFGACGALISVNIPTSVRLIEDFAFDGCTHLDSISIPASVDSIGALALGIYGSINVDPQNVKYSSVDGVLYSKNKTVLRQCPISKNGIFHIPSTVTTIGSYAFGRCSSIISISLPISISSIHVNAFIDCFGLKSIEAYPTSPPVVNLTDSIFKGVNKTTCELYVPIGCKSLYQNAPQWKDFKNIVEGEIPTSKTINLTTPGTLSSLLTTTELYYISNLTITGTIDARDFVTMRDNMQALTTLDLNAVSIAAYTGTWGTYSSVNTVYPANCSPQRAFYNPNTQLGKTSLLSVKLPTSISTIGRSTFAYCSGITSIIIPESVTTIDQTAFSNCTGLSSITIPNNVSKIGSGAFQNCSELFNVTLGSLVSVIDDFAFTNCSKLSTIKIPDTVTLLGYNAFNYCENLATVTFGNSPKIISIGDGAFGYTGLLSLNLPSTILIIGNNSFLSCKRLKSVILPDGLTSIGNRAFSSCDSLQSINFPSSLTSIGDYAFENCYNWTDNIVIPNSVTSIGEMAFNSCYRLSSITINNQISEIKYGSFGGCLNLQSITIPSNVSYIGERAFGLCTGLTSLNIADGVDSIGPMAFSGCTRLPSVNIPSSVKKIDAAAFSLCSNLRTATLSEGIKTIGAAAFANSSILNSSLPLNDLPESFLAPTGNSELNTVFIPSTVTNIGLGGFLGCIDSIQVAADNLHYCSENGVLFNKAKTVLMQVPVSKKGNFNIPESVRTLQRLSFTGCTDLTTINIPEGVDTIGIRTFYGCTGLRNLYANNPLPVEFNSTDSIFNLIDKTACILYVPKDSKVLYQAAEQWKDFKNIIEMTTSTPAVLDENIKLYPNLVTEAFKIEGVTGISTLKLSDLNGKELISKRVADKELISISSLPKGMYVVKLITAEGTIERKIIKK